MTLDDIVKFTPLWPAYLRPAEIRSRFYGRICVSPHLWILYAIRELLGDRCKIYLEIGVMHGGSICVAIGSKYPCTFVGIDPFNGFYDGPVDPYSGIAVTQAIATNNIAGNNLHKHPFHLIKGGSADEDVVGCVKEHYPVIDLLFIDGDHSEEAVAADFENYGALVGPGGIALLDNYDDPSWPGVKAAIDAADLSGWDTVGVFGYALILERQAHMEEDETSSEETSEPVTTNQE